MRVDNAVRASSAKDKSSAPPSSAEDVESQMKDMKRELKEWERAFAAKEGRKPEKQDILADKAIARRYKAYLKIRASAAGGGGDGKEAVGESEAAKPKKARPQSTKAVERGHAKPAVPAAPDNENDSEGINDADVAPARETKVRIRDPRHHDAEDLDDDVRPARGPASAQSSKSSLKQSAQSSREHIEDAQEAEPQLETMQTEPTAETAAAPARPTWGGSAALPENFMLRRNTVASGPISTASLDTAKIPVSEARARPVSMSYAPRPSSAASIRPISTVSAGPTSPLSDSAYGNEEASEFMDFMNRKKQIEGGSGGGAGGGEKPAGAVSALEAIARLQIQAAAQNQLATSPRSESPGGMLHPIVTSITVAAPRPMSATSFNSALPTSPPPEPLTSPQRRELSKPYPETPTEREIEADYDDDDDNDDSNNIRAGGAKTRRERPPPARATVAFAGEMEPDSDDDDEEEEVAPEQPPPPLPVKRDRKRESSAKSRPDASEAPPPQESKDTEEAEEEEEDKDAGAAIAPLTATAPTPGTMCFGADAIGVATNPSLVGVKIFFRLPPEFILRCKLYRKKNILDKAHPTFYLYNQADESFLLAARKRKKSKSVNYVISSSQLDMSKDSKHYVAKLKANFQRTNFVLLDARSYNPRTQNKGFRELACISYTKTVLPREMSVAIPATKIPELSEDYSKDIMSDVKTQNTDKLLFLRNKPPRWNEATQSHCLNFGGRVTQPSIKNCQLIGSENENFVVMQFGRCGPDYFTLDVRYPMTPLEAFGVALSTFDAFDKS
ncbi:Tubby- protein 3 [Geranomyces variabilis]|uniref:Tubby- protein 3 n=1 Tax=Geranomyces variabilis TaxID=109894 RepID=A0AAD5TUG6_9FUNG|nr:Tubby- protein 3 [Geranomyces variabilis]